MIMPGMNGVQLAQAIKTIRPEMRVLFMSGYTDEALNDCGFSDGSLNLIHKPFYLRAIAREDSRNFGRESRSAIARSLRHCRDAH